MNKEISGVKVRKLNLIVDERGSLMELYDKQFCQPNHFYVSYTRPGVVKAWHYHKIQTDCLNIVSGIVKLVLYDDREWSLTKGVVGEYYLALENNLQVSIPPHVHHGWKNIGTDIAAVVNLCSHPYDPNNPDEYRFPPDYERIPYEWGLAIGLKHG